MKKLYSLLFALTICGGFVSAVSTPPVKLLAEREVQSGLLLRGVSDAGNVDRFLYYSPVVVNHLQVGNGSASTAEDVNNFPVTVAVTDARFKTLANSGHMANANAYDLRPYSDTCTTPITAYELQFYDGTTGQIVIVVKRNLSHTVDTTFYLCYDRVALSTNGSSPSTTWSAGYVSVYHMEDSSGSLNLNDSLGNNNIVTNTSVGVSSSTGGVFGAGATYNNASDDLLLSTASWILATGNSAAVTGWIKTSEALTDKVLYRELKYMAAPVLDFELNVLNNTATYNCCAFKIRGTDANSVDVKLNTTANNGAWRLFTLYGTVIDASTYDMNLTLDDGQNNTVTYTQSNRSTNHTFTGNTPDLVDICNGLTAATCDEVHLLNSATRGGSVSDPRQWVFTEYNNGTTPTTFAALGTEVAN